MRFLLNISKRDNFVFYDQKSKMHLSISSPIGFAKEITPVLKRSILAGNVIDIDNVSGVEVDENIKAINDKILKLYNLVPAVAVIKEEKALVKEETTKVVEENVEEIQVEEKPKNKNKNKSKNVKSKEGEN